VIPHPKDGPPFWLFSVGLGLALAYASTEYWLLGTFGFPLDDGWIHLQFAKNLAAGEGMAYNTGQLVTGSTAPAWTALLALGTLLPGSALLWAKLLGTVLYLLAARLAYQLARELGLGRGLAGLATLWTLASYWLVWSALSGMEIPLFAALSLGGMVLSLRERRAPERLPLSFAAFGLGALVRPEGVLLLVLALGDRLLVWRRTATLDLVRPPVKTLATGLALAALVLVPTLLAYTAIGGSPLPTTYASKVGTQHSWVPNMRYLYTVLGILFRPLPFAVLLAAAGAVQLIQRLGTRRDCGLLPALWLVALPVAYSLLSPPGTETVLVGNFGRYFFPLLPLVAILGALGLERANSLFAAVRAGRFSLPLRGIALAVLVTPTFTTLVTGATHYAQNVANVEDGDVAMARWLAPRLDPRALLAVQDIGAMKYLLPNPVLDLEGIASPDARILVRAALSAADPTGTAGMVRFLETHRPDYLAAFPQWYPQLTSPAGPLREVFRLEIPDNITLGGRAIVLYSTPWTRYPLAAPATTVP
jgi:Dolichyl-phosphate-mannose-protein mannosyltransferase